MIDKISRETRSERCAQAGGLLGQVFEERRDGLLPGFRAQQVKAQDVRRALPDGQHLGVAQEARDAGVLDVPGAAEGLDHLAGMGYSILGSEQLDGRDERSKRALFRFARYPVLYPA